MNLHVQIIIKLDFGFNVNKSCKLILVSDINKMKIC
jgi:hypothetical protein